MIQKIQLRGISRTPSDRMVADGGCAESYNVQLDGTETAPSLVPDNETKSILGVDTINGQIVFVHKTSDGTNYIGREDGLLYYYRNKVKKQISGVNIGKDSEIINISNMGNTIILLTDSDQHFIGYKNGEYKYLGTDVPEPKVKFHVLHSQVAQKEYESDDYIKVFDAPIATGDATIDGSRFEYFRKWAYYLSLEGTDASDDDKKVAAELRDVQKGFWSKVQQLINANAKDGIFSAPVLARYALRLYDGEYIHVSAPVYLGAGVKDIFEGYLTIEHPTSSIFETGKVAWKLNAKLNCVYRAWVTCNEWSGDYNAWKDYIESIDIFLSQDLSLPEFNANFVDCNLVGPYTGGKGYFVFEQKNDFEAQICNAGQFYKVASFGINDLSKLTMAGGYDLLSDTDMGRQEYRLTQEQLTADSTARYSPLRARMYNSRLVYGGVRKHLTEGYPFYPAPAAGKGINRVDISSLYIRYFISTDDGREVCIGTRPDLQYSGYEYFKASYGEPIGNYYCVPFGVIFYPDARCRRIEVQLDGRLRSFQMKEHPMLNCSYALLSVEQTLIWFMQNSQIGSPTGTESEYVDYPNKLMLSKVNNMFSYELASTINYQDAITDIAATTKALSTGQFGQFPMMVFTDGGIYSVQLDSEGKFTATHPVARDVAIKDTVTPIDQAIIYTTAKGVKLLTQSDIKELSPEMNGRHYVITENLQISSIAEPWKSLANSLLQDTDTFNAFVADAKAAYDYKGGRLLFFRKSSPYCYSYILASSTWHKVKRYTTGSPVILNSYPECLVSEGGKLVNYSVTLKNSQYFSAVGKEITNYTNYQPQPSFSTPAGHADGIPTASEYESYAQSAAEALGSTQSSLGSTSGLLIPGIIVTRPFTLANPNVRKAITDLRIRGDYNRGDVKYILYGSMDGHGWQRLTSLRGGSYKLFRLMIFTNLAPTERISWVDVEFEPRFTNKLR